MSPRTKRIMDLSTYQPDISSALRNLTSNILVLHITQHSNSILAEKLVFCLHQAGMSESPVAIELDDFLSDGISGSNIFNIVLCVDGSKLALSDVEPLFDKLATLVTYPEELIIAVHKGEAFCGSGHNTNVSHHYLIQSLLQKKFGTVLSISEILDPQNNKKLAQWMCNYKNGEKNKVSSAELISPVLIDDVILVILQLLSIEDKNNQLNNDLPACLEVSAPDNISEQDAALYLSEQLGISGNYVETINHSHQQIDKEQIKNELDDCPSTAQAVLRRPLCKSLMAVEMWASISIESYNNQTSKEVTASSTDRTISLSFVEKLHSEDAKTLLYEKVLFNPSAVYLVRILCEENNIEKLRHENDMLRVSHAYYDNKVVLPDARSIIRKYMKELMVFTSRFYAKFIAHVNRDYGKNRVVFVSMQWNSKLLNEAISLSRRGKKCFIIVLNGSSSDVRNDFYNTFESVLELPAVCLAQLVFLTRMLRPSVFHIFSNMFFNYVSWLIVANSKQSKTVIDYDDYLFLNGRNGFYDTLIDKNMQTLDFETSHCLLENADRHLVPFAPYGVDWLENIHPGIKSKVRTFFNWTSKEPLLGIIDRKLKEPIRFVWAGSVWPYDENTRKYYFSSGLIESIQKLVSLGCEVDVLLDPHYDLAFDDPAWEPYRALEKTGKFNFKPGVSSKELHLVFKEYDFGLLHLTWNSVFESVYPQKFEYSVPNKLFAYLAAGLPVLVSSEMVYQSWLVSHFGLGLVQGRTIHDDLMKDMRDFDFKGFSQRLNEFRQHNNMDKNLSRVLPEYI